MTGKVKISSNIDWQGAWTAPLFIDANPPMRLDYAVEMKMKLPDNSQEFDETMKERLRYQVAQSILTHSYETRNASENPLMYKMMRHLQGKTLIELDAFAGSTWDNFLLPLQECLIRVQRQIYGNCSQQTTLKNSPENGAIFAQTGRVHTTFLTRRPSSIKKMVQHSTKARNFGSPSVEL